MAAFADPEELSMKMPAVSGSWPLMLAVALSACGGEVGGLAPAEDSSRTVNAVDAPTLGAIRWDGWTPGDENFWGIADQWSLHAGFYGDRLPFYARASGTDPEWYAYATGVSGEQDIIDAELAYAKSAGINYFAYVWYDQAWALAKARLLHARSSKRNDVKMAYINWNTSSEAGARESCQEMAASHYMKVLGDRPLVYVFDPYSTITRQNVDALRSSCQQLGTGTPYIVAMNADGVAAAAQARTLGFDAISSYFTGAVAPGEPYARLAERTVNMLNNHARQGPSVVPWVSAGWDPRPRLAYTGGYPYAPRYAPGYNLPAESWAIRSEVFNAFHFVHNWPHLVPANTAIVYAWNEFTEGGWLCPVRKGDRIDTSRLDDLRQVNRSPQRSLFHGARRVSASSTWPGYPPSNAVDDNFYTPWQCQTTTGCTLTVELSSIKRLNKFVISEMYNRTNSFRIRYWGTDGWRELTSAGRKDSVAIGDRRYITTQLIDTSAIQLVIDSAQATPIILEFQGFLS